MTGLPPNTALEFVLPKGSKYSTASPSSSALQDFIIPLTSTLTFMPFTVIGANSLRARTVAEMREQGVRSVFLTLWFPHGLSSDTTAEDVKAALKLEEIPAPWGGPSDPVPLFFYINNITRRFAPSALGAVFALLHVAVCANQV
jgi:hypothetical protein